MVEELKPRRAQARESKPDLAEKGQQARSPSEAKVQMVGSSPIKEYMPEGASEQEKHMQKSRDVYIPKPIPVARGMQYPHWPGWAT